MNLGDAVGLFVFRSKIRLLRAMEFRFEFIGSLAISLLFSFAAPLFQYLIYTRTNGYPGWSFSQIMLFQAVLLLWTGLAKTLFGEVKNSTSLIIQLGLFDRILINPASPLVMILTHGFCYQGLGTFVAGIIALVYCIIKFGIIISCWQVIMFLVFLFSGIALHLSIIIFYCAISLRFVYILRLSDILDRIADFGQFPAEIFSGIFRFFYLTIIPIGIWIYYPSQVLLGRLNLFAFSSLFVIVVLFAGSTFLWNFELKKYSSAGG